MDVVHFVHILCVFSGKTELGKNVNIICLVEFSSKCGLDSVRECVLMMLTLLAIFSGRFS